MRENVMRIYGQINADEYGQLDGNTPEKQLTFSLAFFHSVILERLQFGSIGWNIPYEFNPSDFVISRRHLRAFLVESSISFEALSYVVGELNYGGRVTDRWDRRLLLSLLSKFFREKPKVPKTYTAPSFGGTLARLIDTVNSWPLITQGKEVGLSENASTITARKEANSIFESLIEVQPTLGTASGSVSQEQFALDLMERLLAMVPDRFNVQTFLKRFDMEDTMSTVLHHEILLYNRLLGIISESLSEMRQGLKGFIVIDERLELLNKQLIQNKVPRIWLEASYPSILQLQSYMTDLVMRVKFLDKWVRGGAPAVYKLGAFYHPEEFLSAVLQVYARKHAVPFDTLSWKTVVMLVAADRLQEPPDEGVYIEGLALEGAKWAGQLVECKQRELISILPALRLVPTEEKEVYDPRRYYECPVYRTQNRGSGAMGLQNYIFSIHLQTKNFAPDHWIRRSVAAFITTGAG
jgi:hypothetical protein